MARVSYFRSIGEKGAMVFRNKYFSWEIIDNGSTAEEGGELVTVDIEVREGADLVKAALSIVPILEEEGGMFFEVLEVLKAGMTKAQKAAFKKGYLELEASYK